MATDSIDYFTIDCAIMATDSIDSFTIDCALMATDSIDSFTVDCALMATDSNSDSRERPSRSVLGILCSTMNKIGTINRFICQLMENESM